MAFSRRYGLFLFVGLLIFLNGFIWQGVFSESVGNSLTVAFLDVGQGDSIYIEGPMGRQILVDGGPSALILRELGKAMPFGDTSLDLLIVTNPDKDHYAGFLDVLEKYQVGAVLEPGTKTSGEMYALFKKELKEKNIPISLARRGMSVDVGGGAILSILFPDRDVSNMSTNDGSIIMRLDYGSTSVMFTGDTTRLIEEYLINRYPNDLTADILKVAHHGSKTSTGWRFVEMVSPAYAVISSGEWNSYGHPHQTTLNTLTKFRVKALRTDQEGMIIFRSDGYSFVRR